MTSYELIDLAQSMFANSVSTFAVYLSVVFAYIVSAYLVGAKLTRAQTSMMTFLFVVVSVLLAWSTAAYVQGGVLAMLEANPDRHYFYTSRSWLPHLVLGLGIVVIVIALKFMWDVRHPKSPGRD